MEDMSMVFECTQFDIPIISNLTDIFCVSCTYLVYDLICILCVDNSIVYVPCISCTAKTTLHCIVHHCVSVVLFQLNLHFFCVFCWCCCCLVCWLLFFFFFRGMGGGCCFFIFAKSTPNYIRVFFFFFVLLQIKRLKRWQKKPEPKLRYQLKKNRTKTEVSVSRFQFCIEQIGRFFSANPTNCVPPPAEWNKLAVHKGWTLKTARTVYPLVKKILKYKDRQLQFGHLMPLANAQLTIH